MKINGKKLADKILTDLKDVVVAQLAAPPTLAILQVANLSRSFLYVKQKKRAGERVGVKVTHDYFPKNTKEGEIIKRIKQHNKDDKINGLIVQLPLPKNLDTDKIILKIKPKKDVDGFLPNSPFTPPISSAVLTALTSAFIGHISPISLIEPILRHKRIVIIGRGKTGGEPILKTLRSLKIPTNLIHSKTKNPDKITRKADIIISCVGKPEIIKPENIKRGVILISVGIHREKNGKLRGDYNDNEIKNIASYYTPTPGGIGPLTVACLMKNTTGSQAKRR